MKSKPSYWAERFFPDPYTKQNMAPLRKQHAKNVLISYCVAGAVAGLVTMIAATWTRSTPMRIVALAQATIDIPVVQAPPAKAPASPAHRQVRVEKVVEKPVEKKIAPPKVEVTASLKPKTSPKAAEPVKEVNVVPPASKPVAPPPKPSAQVEKAPSGRTKPVDMASADKLGLRKLEENGIVLANGAHVAVGSRLPNGETLLGVDATKGMVETDRRIMMALP